MQRIEYDMKLLKNMLPLVLLTPAVLAVAQTVTVRGAGTGRCADYLEMRRVNNPSDTYQVAAWVQGFLAGHNVYAGGKAVQAPDVSSTLVELDRFCQAHREQLIADGAKVLAERLGAAKR
jgi:hypothetical protein